MRVARWLATGAFVLGGLAAATLAWAEAVARQDTPAAIERALAIETVFLRTPDASHLERWAELEPWAELRENTDRKHTPEEMRTETAPMEAMHREAMQIEVVRRMVSADPRRSSAWIALGLSAERTGAGREAERDLLQAASVDRQYLPAWTLANFYFRRGDREAFWKWARQAAALTYDDFRPLLRLADAFDSDPLQVLARLGGGAALERGYITFLIGEHRLDGAQVVARKLAALHPPGEMGADAGRLTDLAERSIRVGQAGPALEFWNAVHLPGLDPVRGPILTNAAFAHAPAGEGFDWRMSSGEEACPGVSGAWSPGQVRFRFSGGQREDCVLLTQPLPVTASTVYRLRFEYRTEELSGLSGLRWALEAAHAPADLPASPQWSAAEQTFPSRRAGLAWLALRYRRDPGTIRREGAVVLRNLHLEFP